MSIFHQNIALEMDVSLTECLKILQDSSVFCDIDTVPAQWDNHFCQKKKHDLIIVGQANLSLAKVAINHQEQVKNLYNLCKALLSLGVLLFAMNVIFQCSRLWNEIFSSCLFPLLPIVPSILLSMLLTIPHSEPLHRGLNQHHEWKYRPLGQRKGIISASSMWDNLAEWAFSLEAKRQKCTFPKFLLILESTRGYCLIYSQIPHFLKV